MTSTRPEAHVILRSLGADPGWIGRAMHWQVTAFALVPMVCGAALGIATATVLQTE